MSRLCCSRQRVGERCKKFQPFPYDKFDGKGFNRLDVVDLDKVKRHYEDAAEVVEVDEAVHADGDD